MTGTGVAQQCSKPAFERESMQRVAEAAAYQRDVKSARIHILDAGHFALDTDADKIATEIDNFLAR